MIDGDSSKHDVVRLSVVVATRDRAESLRQLLDSIEVAVGELEQSTIELIVADNGSSDHTPSVVAEFAKLAKFNVIAVREATPGKARALNRALSVSSGLICAFVDDDVVVSQEWAVEILRAFESSLAVDVIGGQVRALDSSTGTVALRDSNSRFRVSWREFNPQNIPLIGCNIAYRRSFFEGNGGFDPDVGPGSNIGSGDDLDLLYRALLVGERIEYRPEIWVYHDHDRVTDDEIVRVGRRYLRGRGAFYHKYASNKHRRVQRWAYWELRGLARSLFVRPWTPRHAAKVLGDIAVLGLGAFASLRIRGLVAPLDHPPV